jgi:hypothetical protein
MLTSDVEKIINKPPALWAADWTREPLGRCVGALRLFISPFDDVLKELLS